LWKKIVEKNWKKILLYLDNKLLLLLGGADAQVHPHPRGTGPTRWTRWRDGALGQGRQVLVWVVQDHALWAKVIIIIWNQIKNQKSKKKLIFFVFKIKINR
jgi:hypothetical protein